MWAKHTTAQPPGGAFINFAPMLEIAGTSGRAQPMQARGTAIIADDAWLSIRARSSVMPPVRSTRRRLRFNAS
jgi:hypothetical protein